MPYTVPADGYVYMYCSGSSYLVVDIRDSADAKTMAVIQTTQNASRTCLFVKKGCIIKQEAISTSFTGDIIYSGFNG